MTINRGAGFDRSFTVHSHTERKENTHRVDDNKTNLRIHTHKIIESKKNFQFKHSALIRLLLLISARSPC